MSGMQLRLQRELFAPNNEQVKLAIIIYCLKSDHLVELTSTHLCFDCQLLSRLGPGLASC